MDTCQVRASLNAPRFRLTASLILAACASCSADDANSGTMTVVQAGAGAGASIAGVSGAAGRSSTGVPQAGAAAGSTSTGVAGSNALPQGGRGLAGSPAAGSSAAAGSGTPAGNSGAIGPDGTGVTSGSGGATAGTGGAAAGGMSGGASGAGGMSSAADSCVVMPITDTMRSKYQNMNDPYYTKYADANGILVGTGAKVDDEAIVRYCRLLKEMTSNDAVRKAVIADKMWFTMIDNSEQLSSLPQIDKAYGTSLNQRARGLGGLTPTICAEDSIMCMPGDRWKGDCICPHETGHTLYSSGIAKVPEMSKRLTAITDATRDSGRIRNSYVWMDGDESGMMAWGVQVWYDCAINGMEGQYHPDINTRAELQKELPDFYQFLSELLPADNQYKDCYANP